ncbi:DnaB-like helicase C-terminal domain-containing protein [Rhodococcus sp. BH5]|uniref:DnaB-like helicase C-terminal domain-containing protein n=1 Tax=Rhodococcus sp. BH5 TaxID=2871702 RepID=UPI0022CD3A2E|nr:DnaB-like helicase C-terminal domain-containing protein [Rhodococcus sp. BH5]MCZ9635289.1 AAA family ATPase [Rhodococcus sp. BH5]
MNITGPSFDTEEELLDAPDEEATLTATLLSLTSRHLLPDLLTQIKPEDFYDVHLGQIWEAARVIQRDGGLVSKRTLLARRDTSAIRARLQRLAGEPVRDTDVHRAAAALKDISNRRHLLEALKRAAEHTSLGSSYSESLHFASEQISGLTQGSIPDDTRTFADAVDTWQEWITTPKSVSRTISTPWQAVNDMLAGGLHPGRSYVVGGRPGEGKSIALLNFASHAAEIGRPAIIFSVEMGETEVVSRILASGAHAEYGQVTKRELDAYNYAQIQQYTKVNRDMPLTLVDKSDITIDSIAARCRTIKRTQGLDVIVVDYLQLLKESDSKQPRERQVAHISRSLKILARELDCAVIVACQLNRNAANADRKPALSELRESGSIEQDADVVILLHHELINNTPTGEVELVIAKNRTGRSGSVVLPWRAHQARLG